jgi:Zn-finger nucleic acid-binding protein
MVTMNCPHCSQETLVQRQVEGSDVAVDICTLCDGVWLDAGELEQLTDVAVRDMELPPSSKVSDRKCPKCSAYLHSFNYPQTYCAINMCRQCRGLWLDADELNEIQLVREELRKRGSLEEEVPGIKGSLIKLINRAIDSLKDF